MSEAIGRVSYRCMELLIWWEGTIIGLGEKGTL